MPVKNKDVSRKRRHKSLRKQISGSPVRPRLVVHRSAKHVYAQVVDDTTNNTLVTASDLLSKKTPAPEWVKSKKQDRAKQIGLLVAKACLAKGISQVVFDRAGYRYHGRVAMIAIGAREGGLKF